MQGSLVFVAVALCCFYATEGAKKGVGSGGQGQKIQKWGCESFCYNYPTTIKGNFVIPTVDSLIKANKLQFPMGTQGAAANTLGANQELWGNEVIGAIQANDDDMAGYAALILNEEEEMVMFEVVVENLYFQPATAGTVTAGDPFYMAVASRVSCAEFDWSHALLDGEWNWQSYSHSNFFHPDLQILSSASPVPSPSNDAAQYVRDPPAAADVTPYNYDVVEGTFFDTIYMLITETPLATDPTNPLAVDSTGLYSHAVFDHKFLPRYAVGENDSYLGVKSVVLYGMNLNNGFDNTASLAPVPFACADLEPITCTTGKAKEPKKDAEEPTKKPKKQAS